MLPIGQVTEYSEQARALGTEGSADAPVRTTLPRPALDDDGAEEDADGDDGGVAAARLPIRDAPPDKKVSFRPPPAAEAYLDAIPSAGTATTAEATAEDRGSVFEPNAFVQDRHTSTLRLKSVRRLNPLFDVTAAGDEDDGTAQDDAHAGDDPDLFLSQEVVGDAEMEEATES